MGVAPCALFWNTHNVAAASFKGTAFYGSLALINTQLSLNQLWLTQCRQEKKALMQVNATCTTVATLVLHIPGGKCIHTVKAIHAWVQYTAILPKAYRLYLVLCDLVFLMAMFDGRWCRDGKNEETCVRKCNSCLRASSSVDTSLKSRHRSLVASPLFFVWFVGPRTEILSEGSGLAAPTRWLLRF